MQPRVSVLALMVMLSATGLASCALDIGDRRLALSLEDRRERREGVPTLVGGPTFLAAEHVAGTGPSVDSDADGTADTYGPTDIVRIVVDFSEQVCGDGTLALTLRTGDGPSVTRHAKYCGTIRRINRRGETIRLTADFTEPVVVDASGGVPTLGLQVGDIIRHATWVGDEWSGDEHRVHFEYVVREGDRDDDGKVWVPANGLRVPAGSSIRDVAGNDASLGWSVASGRDVRIDGR